MGTLRRAVNLYSFREMPGSLPATIRRVSEAGFAGVEFANRFQEADPVAVAAELDESGIEPVAAHVRFEDAEAAVKGENDLLERCETVGCDRLVVKYIAPRHFRTRRAVRSLSGRLTDIAAGLDSHDMELGYHMDRFSLYPILPGVVDTLFDATPVPEGAANHAMRWLSVARRNDPMRIPDATALANLSARTHPEDLFFELETAEVRAAGFDPAAALSTFSGRVPLVHLRDITPRRFGASEDATNGEGAVDFRSVVDRASAAGVEWLVYENEMDLDPKTKLAEATAFLDQLLSDDGQVRSRGTARADSR